MRRAFEACALLALATILNAGCFHSKPERAIITDYHRAAISTPPAHLDLDPFYQKYVDAQGIPITTSANVPDVALLVARDIIVYMLSDRPDVRNAIIEDGGRLGIMAQSEMTTDLPEQRDWKKPSLDDARLTDYERANYDVIAAMTDAEYWNKRARGMGGRYTTCAEENVLGYPGTRYFGENICVHEWSHSIHRGIREVDPELAQAIEAAYQDAKAKGLWEGHYASNTVAEYWAEGTQFWFNSNYEYENGNTYILTSDDLKRYDPVLYELLGRVYPDSHRIPMDVFYNHEARIQNGRRAFSGSRYVIDARRQ
jgi:hypothetical protein